MSKGVVYTSIFGDYDRLITPIITRNEFDYICFTDNPQVKSNVWDVRIIEPKVPDDSYRSARYVKINAHKFLSDFDYSVYIDGNMHLRRTPDVLAILNGHKLVMVTHPTRDCIYDEARACTEMGKDDPDIIATQMDVYKKWGFTSNNGLCETGFHFKLHNDAEIIRRCKLWWRQVKMYSFRDQLSFPFAFQNFPMHHISASKRNYYARITNLHPCPGRNRSHHE